LDKPKTEYMNPYLAGIFLGIVLFLSFVLFGHGLGASGGLAKVVASIVDIFSPGHVDRNAYLIDMLRGNDNPLDDWLVYEIIGVIIGGFLSGIVAGRVKIETFKGPRINNPVRWTAAFCGGAIAGFAVRLARGCTSGQALSGGASLSLGSWAFMFSVFGGGYVIAYFVRKLWTEGDA